MPYIVQGKPFVCVRSLKIFLSLIYCRLSNRILYDCNIQNTDIVNAQINQCTHHDTKQQAQSNVCTKIV